MRLHRKSPDVTIRARRGRGVSVGRIVGRHAVNFAGRGWPCPISRSPGRQLGTRQPWGRSVRDARRRSTRVHLGSGCLCMVHTIPTDTTPVPHVVACLLVVPRRPDPLCRSGPCGRGRERPAASMPNPGIAAGGVVHHPTPRPPGRSRTSDPCAGRTGEVRMPGMSGGSG